MKARALCGREMIEAKCGRLGNANFATGEVPAVTHDYVTVAIDQDWDIEAESLDAVGNLPDLPLTVPAWVVWIRFELRNPRAAAPRQSTICCSTSRKIARGSHPRPNCTALDR
jgi:hypothetical protein